MCNCKQHEYELMPELERHFTDFRHRHLYKYELEGEVSSNSGTQTFVKGFSGPNAECATALRSVGKTQAEALAIINTQIAEAIRMLRVAAGKLKRGSRSQQTIQLFQKIFRVSPTFVPSWFKPTASIKDRGDIVAVRCLRVADLLASGHIRFFCAINGTNCPDCERSSPGAFACSSFGNDVVICLGTSFWEDMKNGNLDSMRATLMHEPFHIYFGTYVTEHDISSSPTGTGRHVGKFGGIRCILQFVFEINGQVAQPRDSEGCSKTMVRSK